MKKINITLAQKHGYFNIIFGLSFFLITFATQSKHPILSYGGMIIADLLLIAIVISYMLKSEIEDERSQTNLNRAGHWALLFTNTIICIYLALSKFINLNLQTDAIVKLIIGFATVTYGILFLYFERN